MTMMYEDITTAMLSSSVCNDMEEQAIVGVGIGGDNNKNSSSVSSIDQTTPQTSPSANSAAADDPHDVIITRTSSNSDGRPRLNNIPDPSQSLNHEEMTDILQGNLTRKESKAVFWLRLVVLMILVLTAVAVSITVYEITRRGEASEFETQYQGAATKVIESFADIVYEMGAISGLGVANSAHSVDHKSEWPFVTLSNFQQRYVCSLFDTSIESRYRGLYFDLSVLTSNLVYLNQTRAGNARHLSGALMVSISPIVQSHQFQEWDEFVNDSANNYWM